MYNFRIVEAIVFIGPFLVGVLILCFRICSNITSNTCAKIAGIMAISSSCLEGVAIFRYSPITSATQSLKILAAICLGIALGIVICLKMKKEFLDVYKK
jgi:hypothetical protein